MLFMRFCDLDYLTSWADFVNMDFVRRGRLCSCVCLRRCESQVSSTPALRRARCADASGAVRSVFAAREIP